LKRISLVKGHYQLSPVLTTIKHRDTVVVTQSQVTGRMPTLRVQSVGIWPLRFSCSGIQSWD